jgi:hypothetical protein
MKKDQDEHEEVHWSYGKIDKDFRKMCNNLRTQKRL